MNDRLTRTDWLDHGLRTLAGKGPNALKADPLAAGLGVSRGSFYWHFRDIADFRAQVLESWRERTTEQIIRDMEAQQAEPDRLGALMTAAFTPRPAAAKRPDLWAAEDAIRSWAMTDAKIAAVVAAVDERRTAYIAELLTAAGVARETASARAVFLYWAYLGQAVFMGRSAALAPAALAGIVDLLRR